MTARIKQLELYVADLRAVMLSLQPPEQQRTAWVRDIVYTDIGDAARSALIELAGGAETLTDWGIADIFAPEGKMNIDIHCRVYAPVGSQTNTFVFVTGPGPVVDEMASTLVEPAWSVGNIFPYLIRTRVPFFNAHIPTNAAPNVWVPSMYQGMRQCNGAAIITFYAGPRWTGYWELAATLYFLGAGASSMFFNADVDSMRVAGSPDATVVQNIRGTRASAHTMAQRQSDVYAIIRTVLRVYQEAMRDPVGRVFVAVHADRSTLVPDIESDLAARADGLAGTVNTLATRMEVENTFATAMPPIAAAMRVQWRGLLFAGLHTDVATYMSYVYELSLFTSLHRDAPYNLGYENSLYIARGAVASLLDGYLASARLAPHYTSIMPIALLLNCMLPEDMRVRL